MFLIPASHPAGVPPEGTRPSLYFFFLSLQARPPSCAGQVPSLPRSSLFPAGPFSPLAGFSRLAPGHYLIFRLETSHPQEKRSRAGGRGARGGRKGGHRTGGDWGKCFRVITFVSASAFPLLISSRAFYPRLTREFSLTRPTPRNSPCRELESALLAPLLAPSGKKQVRLSARRDKGRAIKREARCL